MFFKPDIFRRVWMLYLVMCLTFVYAFVVSLQAWRTAGRQWLGLGPDTGDRSRHLDGALARLRFLWAAPAERSLFGRDQVHVQPACRWADGTTLSLW